MAIIGSLKQEVCNIQNTYNNQMNEIACYKQDQESIMDSNQQALREAYLVIQ